jgi:Ca2+-binding RTX toxin-like protein
MNDTLRGNSLNNTLVGLDGNDTLDGGGGSDSLVGGFGDDNYIFGAAVSAESDIVWEPSVGGTDTLDFSQQTTAVSVNLGILVVQSVHTNRTLKLNSGITIENLEGGSGNDSLTGNSRDNVLSGNAGNDRLVGGQGNDSLTGGLGDDVYIFGPAAASESDLVIESIGEGIDTLGFSTLTVAVTASLSSTSVQNVHSNRTLQISSGDSIENLIGGSGHDVLTGNIRNNVLTGNAGNDVLTGLAGDDRLVGGTGDDVYLFDTALSPESDILIELANAGHDTIDFSMLTTNVTLTLASAASQTVHTDRAIQLSSSATFEGVAGGSATDILTGNSAANVLVGNGGDDNLSGNGGRDLLIGGTGLDTISGGADDDILIAGSTLNDALFTKLQILLATWKSTDAYGIRVSNLRAGVGSPAVSLQAGINVSNDSSPADSLTGGSGDDWYLAAIDDVITGLLAGELLDVL